MQVLEHKAFKQMLINNQAQRLAACDRILKAHGISCSISDIRVLSQNIYDRPKGTPRKELEVAWLKAQAALVKFIENYGEPLDYAKLSAQEVNELLLDACFASAGNYQFDRIPELIEHGADVNARDEYGNQAFSYLILRFNSSGRDHQGNMIFKVVPVVTEELLKCFLKAGIDINESCGYCGLASTYWLILAGSADITKLRLMLEHGARINDCDSNGRTALMGLYENHADPACIKLLLDDIAIARGYFKTACAIKSVSEATADFYKTPAGLQVKQLRAEIIAKIKAGYMFETGNREGYSQLSWKPSFFPPCFILYENDLGGTRTRRINSDDNALELIYSYTQSRNAFATELSIYEQAMGSLSNDPSRDLKKEAAKTDANVFSTCMGKYKDLCSFALPLLQSEDDLKKLMSALDKMFSHKFGYSDRQIDMQAMIPAVFEIARRHVHSLKDLLLLCAETPRIIAKLPEESEESPVGYMHSYDINALKVRGMISLTMAEFVSAEPILTDGKEVG